MLVQRERTRVQLERRTDAHSSDVLRTMESSQASTLCLGPKWAPKLALRFAHLVRPPQVSPLSQAQYVHCADASWLAAAGSAVAGAATEDAADIHMQNVGQLDPTPTPEPDPISDFSDPGLVGVVRSSINNVGLTAHQPERVAKRRSHPFCIPRSFLCGLIQAGFSRTGFPSCLIPLVLARQSRDEIHMT